MAELTLVKYFVFFFSTTYHTLTTQNHILGVFKRAGAHKRSPKLTRNTNYGERSRALALLNNPLISLNLIKTYYVPKFTSLKDIQDMNYKWAKRLNTISMTLWVQLSSPMSLQETISDASICIWTTINVPSYRIRGVCFCYLVDSYRAWFWSESSSSKVWAWFPGGDRIFYYFWNLRCSLHTMEYVMIIHYSNFLLETLLSRWISCFEISNFLIFFFFVFSECFTLKCYRLKSSLKFFASFSFVNLFNKYLLFMLQLFQN